MKDRFDLENEIMALYAFADQLGNVSAGLMEERLTTDEAVNAIEGINVLLKLQTEKMFDTLTQCFRLDGYRHE
jgi:RNase H-fold protein (predicted Holliday junction resolvase)